jgi:hypothetical protein
MPGVPTRPMCVLSRPLHKGMSLSLTAAAAYSPVLGVSDASLDAVRILDEDGEYLRVDIEKDEREDKH